MFYFVDLKLSSVNQTLWLSVVSTQTVYSTSARHHKFCLRSVIVLCSPVVKKMLNNAAMTTKFHICSNSVYINHPVFDHCMNIISAIHQEPINN